MALDHDLTREEKADAISEGVALAAFNDEGVRGTLTGDVVTAILNDCGYEPQQAVEEFAADPHEFLWESCAALAVRDRLWSLWGMGEVKREDEGAWGSGQVRLDHLDLAHRTLGLVCGYDDTVLWQRIARDLMPSPEILTEIAIRRGIIDRPRDDKEEDHGEET
jgi:hypothetical protein